MNSKTNVKILVCAHKPADLLANDIYMPLQVGKAISDVDLGIQGDDTGENISNKNLNYCELTALYWAWKNLKDVDYIGLCHYRRFLDFRFSRFRVRHKYSIQFQELESLGTALPDISSFFKKYDIVLPRPAIFIRNLRDEYYMYHIKEDFDILREVVTEMTPDYRNAFEKVMDHNNKLISYNMFLTKKEIFDDYCSWVFPILFEVEKRIKISAYPYQARVFGFMGERLFNIYCYHHKLKVKSCPMLFVYDQKQRTDSLFYYFIKRLQVHVAYRMMKMKM